MSLKDLIEAEDFFRNYIADSSQQRLRHKLFDPGIFAVVDTVPMAPLAVQAAARSTNKFSISLATDYAAYKSTVEAMVESDHGRHHFSLPSYQFAFQGTAIVDEVRRRTFGARLENFYPEFLPLMTATRAQGFLAPTLSASEFQEALNPPDSKTGIYFLGYPTRTEIKRLDQDHIDNIRRKLGVANDEPLLTVGLGSQGKKQTVDIVKQLTQYVGLKAVIMVLPGTNESIVKEIKGLPLHSGLRVIFPDQSYDQLFLGPREINEILNASDLFIGKPGGSQSAEVHLLYLPMLMMFPNSMEIGNRRLLENTGLGEFVDTLDQLNGVVERKLKTIAIGKSKPEPKILPIQFDQQLRNWATSAQQTYQRESPDFD